MTKVSRLRVVLLVRGLAFLCVMLAAVGAAAAETELRLEFLVPDDRAPTHVCVVTSQPGKIAENVPPNVSSTRINGISNFCSSNGGGCGKDLLAIPDWHAHDLQLFNPQKADVIEPMSGLYRRNNEHQCNYGGTGCAPLFSFRGVENPPDAYITCVINTTNPKQEGSSNTPTPNTTSLEEGEGQPNRRGLMLSLSGRSGPYLNDLRLDGKQLSITLDKRQGVAYLVRVLGGFYVSP